MLPLAEVVVFITSTRFPRVLATKGGKILTRENGRSLVQVLVVDITFFYHKMSIKVSLYGHHVEECVHDMSVSCFIF